jgi:serine/threonine protein kinase
MSLQPGTRLGPYEIERLLGEGGMGVVYKARDVRLKRDVAIKVLPQEFAADAGRLRRFEQEAQAASALNHSNIATIYGIDSQDGTSFIAMEYVPGRTLAEVIPRNGLDLSHGELERIVARCLRKDPDRRFQTAADLKVALEELREETESGERSPAGPAPRRRRRRVLFAGLLSAGVTAVSSLFLRWEGRNAESWSGRNSTTTAGCRMAAGSFMWQGRGQPVRWRRSISRAERRSGLASFRIFSCSRSVARSRFQLTAPSLLPVKPIPRRGKPAS